MTMPRVAVLLMAYGSPDRLEDVPAYLADIREGRTPSAEAVKELTERYRRVGLPTPLLRVTRKVATGLERALATVPGVQVRAYVGMKHWRPRIPDAIVQAAGDRTDQLVVVPMAPHFSRISIGGYRKRVEDAVRSLQQPFALHLVESWHNHPPYCALWARNVQRALAQFARPQELVTIFTAHSLPARIIAEGDPYRDQLLETSRLVAERAGSIPWRFAFQSASHTGEPWLGPDLLETLEELATEGVAGVVVAPIGFVCDHLEIIYDIDIAAQQRATQLGIRLVRTELPNDDPAFIAALAQLIVPLIGAARAPAPA